jgi:hypothetical protein
MKIANPEKRVVVVSWKNIQETEVFSNLKNFCLSYPQYSYNTLSNYLSKEKIAYENDFVKVERKVIVSKVKPRSQAVEVRAIAPVVRKVALKEANDDDNDLRYWLSQPAQKRAAATTFLAMQMLKKGQRMDKTFVNRIDPK